MPIYEFYSPDTRKIYSFLARSLSYAECVPRCPDGAGGRMRKLVSGFSITGKRKEEPKTAGDGPDLDDPFGELEGPQAEAAMRELERSIEGMDEDNPDPRQMGRLMRRMCDLTGECMDEPMEEVVRKLEEGMDPEQLEESMGDVFGDEEGEPGGMPETGADAGEEGGSSAARLLRRLRSKPLVRDPELYEFSDYVD